MKGRKRHLLVDTLGLALAVVVHSASVQDADGARWLMEQVKGTLPRLACSFADSGYAGLLALYVRLALG